MSKSIKKRFLSYILPVQLATLLLLGLTAYLFSSRIVTSQAEENFKKTIDVVFRQIETDLVERLEKIKILARSPSLVKFVSAPYYKSSFDVDVFNFQKGNGLELGEPEVGGSVNFPVGFLANEGNKKVEYPGMFPSVEFINKDGYVVQHVYVGGSNDADFEISDNPKLNRKDVAWFKEAMKGNIYISKPQMEKIYLREYNPVDISLKERVENFELITIAFPYKLGDNVAGVLMVTTTADFLKFHMPEDSRDTLLMVVDKNSDPIISVGKTSSVDTYAPAEIREILSDEQGKIVEFDGQLMMYQRIPVADWAVIIAKDKKDIFASVFSLRNRMALIIIVSIVLMAVLIAIVIRKLLMPIINLRNASERIAGGELGLTVDKEGEDEIATLTDSFNTMSTRVKHMHVELEKSNIRLANVGYVRKQMLQLISHELRTPMTGIIGFYELLDEQIKAGNLSDESSLEEARDLMSNMGMSIKEFETLIYRLTKAAALVTSDPMAERAEDFAPADLKSTLNIAHSKIKGPLAERNIKLNINVPDNCLVKCPNDMLEMLFHEAISNSIKYSDQESAIDISAEIKNDVVEISIADNGCGIPQKYMDEVLEPFFEVADALHHSTGRYKAEGGGLGLGMTIIINTVKKYGGVMEILSKEGEGTALKITLPVGNVVGF